MNTSPSPSAQTHTLYSPATLKSGVPLSSEPFPIHGEYIEDVMHERSGRSRKKSLTAQMMDTHRQGASKRRNELLANPLRLAFSRHPRWLGVTKTPFPSIPTAEPIARDQLPVHRAPLALRIPLLRARPCVSCLKLTGILAS